MSPGTGGSEGIMLPSGLFEETSLEANTCEVSTPCPAHAANTSYLAVVILMAPCNMGLR